MMEADPTAARQADPGKRSDAQNDLRVSAALADAETLNSFALEERVDFRRRRKPLIQQ
jgi:hypothetical protein